MLDETKIKAIATGSIRATKATKAGLLATPELQWVCDQFLFLVEAIEKNGFNFRSNSQFILAFMDVVLDKEKLSSADPYADKRDFIHETAGKTPQKVRYV